MALVGCLCDVLMVPTLGWSGLLLFLLFLDDLELTEVWIIG